MTRYSRSVITGRPHGEDGGEKAAIDSLVFGAKKKQAPAPANDTSDPDFLPPVEDDEADLLVGRSNADRRKNDERRKAGADRRGNDERRAAGRRPADYAPLREQGGYRSPDDGKRGPILLVGALLIVVVFGVVVWNAYREDGEAGDTQVVAELGESGPFKRPFIDTRETPAPTIAEEAEVLDALDGAPRPSPVASSEVRPSSPPPPPAASAPATPAPAKRQPPPEANPPAPLSTPPVRAAAAVTEPGPVALTPAPTVKPPAAPPAPKPLAATPAASGVAAPAFSAGGVWLAQIASTSSEAGAIEEWSRRAKAWPDLFSSAERSIQTADVNGQTRYRLRVGAFASKADATAYCAEVKARGGNCLPAQR